MNTNKNINEWVNNTLSSLDDVTKATAKPYLLTRINAKMQNSQTTVWDKALYFISKPIVAAACMLFIIGVNVFIISKNYSANNTTTDEQYVVLDEYNTNITTLNYTENIEP